MTVSESHVPEHDDFSYVLPISGFWRRFLAFIVDIVAIGIVSFIIGSLFYDWAIRLFGWGRLVGFALTATYFGVLNSSVGNGQTIGKRLFKIRVTDRQGAPISLGRSLARSGILFLPYFINATMLPASVNTGFWTLFIGWFSTTALGAVVYLYVFNRGTRQSLHDLVMGTFVTEAKPLGTVTAQMWRGHLSLVAGWAIGTMLLVALMQGSFTATALVDELITVQRAVEQVAPGPVLGVSRMWSVERGLSGQRSPGADTSTVRVIIGLPHRLDPARDQPDEIAEAIVASLPATWDDVATIVVMARIGYDFGFTSFSETFGATYVFDGNTWGPRD